MKLIKKFFEATNEFFEKFARRSFAVKVAVITVFLGLLGGAKGYMFGMTNVAIFSNFNEFVSGGVIINRRIFEKLDPSSVPFVEHTILGFESIFSWHFYVVMFGGLALLPVSYSLLERCSVGAGAAEFKENYLKKVYVSIAGLFIFAYLIYGGDYSDLAGHDAFILDALKVFLWVTLFCLIGSGGYLFQMLGRSVGYHKAVFMGTVTGLLVVGLQSMERYFTGYMWRSYQLFDGTLEMTPLVIEALPPMLVAGGILSHLAYGAVVSALLLRAEGERSLKPFILPVLLCAVFVFAGSRFAGYCDERFHMDGGELSEVVGLKVLSGSPSPRRALLLKDSIGTYGMDVTIRFRKWDFLNDPFSDDDTYYFDALPENIEPLNKYLAATKGRETYYTKVAAEARRDIAVSNWLVDEYRALLFENVAEYGLQLDSIMLLNSMAYAPGTPQIRDLLEMLGDEERFFISGRAKVLLARAWSSHGDGDESRRWFETAQEEGIKTGIWSLPGEPVFTGGEVRGEVKVDVEGARVGLFYVSGLDNVKDADRVRGRLLMDSMELPPGGAFSFIGLAERSYYLGLLMPMGVTGPFDIKGGGVFEISAENPPADLGVIEVKLSGEVVLSDKD